MRLRIGYVPKKELDLVNIMKAYEVIHMLFILENNDSSFPGKYRQFSLENIMKNKEDS